MNEQKTKHPVDVYVGGKIRQLRWVKGVTQQGLANQVGIKFQQIQKYETGMNRVSASRLWEIAKALETDICFFFEGFEEGPNQGESEARMSFDKETASLVRFYSQIPSEQRKKIFDLAKLLAQ